ncbi:hypothetical protein FQN54_000006 [Arachnomyces sp. PD_36]|nr:hypothetical protein FQN54_000006 [Arachnomyces sp. PD_36]
MARNTPKVKDPQDLFKKPLYVYDLPTELLVTLTSKTNGQQAPIAESEEELAPKSEQPGNKNDGVTSATSCSMCKVSFHIVQEQREHVRSDHHRYNLKCRMKGTPPLDEEAFAKLVGELDESISGSESEESEDSDTGLDGTKPEQTTLTALLKKQAKISQEADENESAPKRGRNPGKQPIFWFSSSLFPSNTSLGIYRALFTKEEQEETGHLVESVKNKQVPTSYKKGDPKIANEAHIGNSKPSPQVFLCMIGGGHFAAMIVALGPEIDKNQGSDRQARVIAHKTFHRYTTRRKQGGGQSAMDSAKGAAQSAGSMIRRHNEVALENEIRELLGGWKSMIDNCELLFVKAPGTTNRRILFGSYEGNFLKQNDPRMRSFPFNTRRATQTELMRAFTELTRVKVSQIDEAALAEAELKQQEEKSKPTKAPVKQQKPKLSKEDEAAMLHTSQIQALIRRSKAPALLSYLSNNSISPSFNFYSNTPQQNYHAPTPLHLASSSNSPAIILALLTKADADPTILNGDKKPPFDLAGDRPTRDAFRVARHELGESKWDWDSAHVPQALSKADADRRDEREKKEADEAEAKRRKAETERLRKEDMERHLTQGGRKPSGRTLAALEKTGAEKREEEARGMTPEMRMRLERERRARAAEARMRNLQGGG